MFQQTFQLTVTYSEADVSANSESHVLAKQIFQQMFQLTVKQTFQQSAVSANSEADVSAKETFRLIAKQMFQQSRRFI